ncbi:MAG: DUF5615 family PIN-like protein [Gemmataceae bacterium]
MPLSYVLDEHLRRGSLWRAIQRHNAAGVFLIDVVQVGDPPGLPLGSTDPYILHWAEREGRIIVSLDRDTMPGHVVAHLQAGHHCAGIFIIRPQATIPQIVDYLVIAAYTSDPAILQDRCEFIP